MKPLLATVARLCFVIGMGLYAGLALWNGHPWHGAALLALALTPLVCRIDVRK